jgi:hypothetical protein
MNTIIFIKLRLILMWKSTLIFYNYFFDWLSGWRSEWIIPIKCMNKINKLCGIFKNNTSKIDHKALTLTTINLIFKTNTSKIDHKALTLTTINLTKRMNPKPMFHWSRTNLPKMNFWTIKKANIKKRAKARCKTTTKKATIKKSKTNALWKLKILYRLIENL